MARNAIQFGSLRSDVTVETFASLLNAQPDLAVPTCRERLEEATEQLKNRFLDGESVETLVAAHAALIDVLLCHLWRHYGLGQEAIALIAVGGYGRGELHPGSDIDILLLLADTAAANDAISAFITSLWDSGLEQEAIALIAVGGYGRGELHPGSDIDILLLLADTAAANDAISAFITSLWDSGLEIGHSVRTVAQCRQEAENDVTVATTLMESRVLAGEQDLFDAMTDALTPDKIWPANTFFSAKLEEQKARHARYDDTGYNLEPNVKGSPGGLRDIQMVTWVAARHFGTNDLHSLVNVGFLTEGQYQRLVEGRQYLWKLRYGLHILTGRREDRLLFDHQKSLAELLGYEDARYTLGVEQMMQRYYRTVMQLSRLNEMLLQLFEENLLLDSNAEPIDIDTEFVAKNGYLKVRDESVFTRNPSALLTLFCHMQVVPNLKGVSAETIGAVRRSLHLIDEEFRQNPRNQRMFLEIIKAKRGVTAELRRMNRYGVLGLYLPAFGRIVGRMQYDLFHAYTVDEHTLFVVANLRRFAIRMTDDEFRHNASVMQRLDTPWLAYLAGLFHDIAKGRGGDHSELGAVDALAFCREHGLDENDAQLVSWLVANHLVLSMTAQKKDITDPDVIAAFAKRMGDQRHLDYLYVLTAADVRGTNPKLWNSWKAKLFRDLHAATSDALARGLQNPLEKASLVADTAEEAKAKLLSKYSAQDIDDVWTQLPAEYFLRHSPYEIEWHTSNLIRRGQNESMIDVRTRDDHKAVAIMIYTPHIQHTFAAATAALDVLGLSVLDARIEPIKNEFSLDTYIVAKDGGVAFERDEITEIRARLAFITERKDDFLPQVTRKIERRQRMFETPTRISFRANDDSGRTPMELVCADYPGLLLTVGQILIKCQTYINSAKIVTIGERAEDVFYLMNDQEEPLTKEQQEALKIALQAALDEKTNS
ncbi:MAG: [protein-PII] uridylyltransferase [Pseudomonadota bacterium]